MDQNLTSILINRRDHRLKKSPAYHLDLFVCGIFVYPICSFLGKEMQVESSWNPS
jgi:hypothetical protein